MRRCNRWKTIGAGFVFFAAVDRGLSAVCRSRSCRPRISPTRALHIELPPGGTLEDTARVSAAASRHPAQVARSDQHRRVRRQRATVACASADVYIEPRAAHQRTLSQKQWEQRMMPLLKQVPDGQLNFSDNGGGRDMQLLPDRRRPAAGRADRARKLHRARCAS